MSDISTKKVMMAMATMALLPWKCPIYRGRKSTLQVPNMHRGHMSANVTLLGGGGEGVEEVGGGEGGGGDLLCKCPTCTKDRCPPISPYLEEKEKEED